MMVVTTSGYIVSVLGPYFADCKNNDAGILNNMIQCKGTHQEGDTFIVDRGLRDSADVLCNFGIKMEKPCFLPRGARQHSTEESNYCRLITKVHQYYVFMFMYNHI